MSLRLSPTMRLLASTLATAACVTRMAPAGVAMTICGDTVPRAEFEALRAELMQARQQLSTAEARLDALGEGGGARQDDTDATWAVDKVERAFEEVDTNGDGVLTLEEFRKGYALLTGDAVAMAFEQMDSDGNGTLDKEEFCNGFALLTSDSARAEAERNKVEAAVADARIAAVKEAAKNLAEAQLMDALFGDPPPGKTRWPKGYTPVPGRDPLRGKSPSKSWRMRNKKSALDR